MNSLKIMLTTFVYLLPGVDLPGELPLVFSPDRRSEFCRLKPVPVKIVVIRLGLVWFVENKL